MRSYYFYMILCVTVGVFAPAMTIAQTGKSDSIKIKKNVVRFNLSNFLLFGSKNIIFGYERVVSPTQSFSINVGHAALPNLFSINADSFNINKQSSKSGFNVSADYRFYLKAENRHQAPRGVYFGPYFTYNNVNKTTNWTLKHSSGNDNVSIDTRFAILGMGIQMGYQFVLFKRMTLDFVLIGPGLAKYKLQADIDSSVTAEERQQLLQAIQQAVENKYPGMNLVMENHQITSDGRLNVTSLGFRYLIQVGYRF